MSALAGFLNLDSAPADPQLVAAQMARLKHCGPDGSGTFTDGPVALGHALLSITPESVAETSPWCSADGQRVITFDGRLDHRADLCAALGMPLAERHVPDPELVLRAQAQWGEECAAKLEGEFAFALWDRRRQELFCACDTVGQRRFFYHCSDRRFVFASRIGSVLAVPGVPRVLDELSLACQLGGLPKPGDHTLYAGIRLLPGSRTLMVRPGGQPQIRRYWQLACEPEIHLRRPEEYAETLRELLVRSVRSALRTRHPVAIMLSGGLDSTGVACLAARELAARGERITTLSNVLPEDFAGAEWAHEESGFIRSTLARYPNMEPHWALGRALPVVQFDDGYYDLHDEPDEDTKSYRTAEMARLAAQQGARTVLGGVGGDRTASFTGDGRLEQLARTGHWLELVQQVRAQARVRELTFPGVLRREVLRPLASRWLRPWLEKPPQAAVNSAPINPDFASRMKVADLRRAAGRDGADAWDAKRRWLLKVNAGRLNGCGAWITAFEPALESPQPLMDRRLWEWCLRVPLGEFVRDGMPRSLFRRALGDVLPESILRRTSKGWFAPDYQQRIAACTPAIEAFLSRYPPGDIVWSYVQRETVEATLRHLKLAGPGGEWDDRYPGILCRGLRLAHFVAWFHQGGR